MLDIKDKLATQIAEEIVSLYKSGEKRYASVRLSETPTDLLSLVNKKIKEIIKK